MAMGQDDPRKLTKPTTVNEALLDRSVSHGLQLERLKTAEARKIVRLLDRKIIPDLTGKIARRLTNIKQRGFDTAPVTNVRLRYLFRALSKAVSDGYNEMYLGLKEDLIELAGFESEFQTRMIENSVPKVPGVTIELEVPAQSTLRSIVTQRPFDGQLLKPWMTGAARTYRRGLENAINIGLAQGETIPQISRRLNIPHDTARRQATAITRTAVNHTVTQARELTYEENRDVVKAVQYVSTLDTRTTEICISLDGQVFPISEGPRPPQHINCRSTTTPVLKSWRELGFDVDEIPPGSRASMDGQVAEEVTYPQWLKRQSVGRQNDALGVGKANLFRDGKLDIAKFNGVGDRPLTLAQLRKREGL